MPDFFCVECRYVYKTAFALENHLVVTHKKPRQPTDTEMLDWLLAHKEVGIFDGHHWLKNRQAIADAMRREKEQAK